MPPLTRAGCICTRWQSKPPCANRPRVDNNQYRLFGTWIIDIRGTPVWKVFPCLADPVGLRRVNVSSRQPGGHRGDPPSGRCVSLDDQTLEYGDRAPMRVRFFLLPRTPPFVARSPRCLVSLTGGCFQRKTQMVYSVRGSVGRRHGFRRRADATSYRKAYAHRSRLFLALCKASDRAAHLALPFHERL